MPLPLDPLTKLIHEEELKSQYHYELQRCIRFGWDLGVVLVEPHVPASVRMDHQYALIQSLAAACNPLMRIVDRGFRYRKGIVYLLPETPEAGVERVKEKIQEVFWMDADSIALPNGENFYPSLAFGSLALSGKKILDKESPSLSWQEVASILRGSLSIVTPTNEEVEALKQSVEIMQRVEEEEEDSSEESGILLDLDE